MSKNDVIKVAVSVGRGIAVHAKGHPAKIVAVGAAAGVAVLSVAVGYGAYQGVKSLAGKSRIQKKLTLPKQHRLR